MLIEVVVYITCIMALASFILDTRGSGTSQDRRERLNVVIVCTCFMICFICFKDLILKDIKAHHNFCIHNNWESETSMEY